MLIVITTPSICFLVAGPPINVELTNHSSSELLLTWKFPSDPHGSVSAFLVTWRRTKDDKDNTIVGDELKEKVLHNASQTQFVIKNLGKCS